MVSKIYKFPSALNNTINAYCFLSEFSHFLENTDCNRLILDMSDVSFIASNQFAVLGCLLKRFMDTHPNSFISINNLQNPIIEMIRKNGFYSHFVGIEPLPDTHNTVVPYKVFNVTEIREYEAYLTLKIFSRDDLPVMSGLYKNMIQDYLLEVFKNVVDHTSSTKVFTCGQFFPKKKLLYFTIVDSGETIPYNVSNYFNKINCPQPSNVLSWVLQEGTTTLADKAPRGVGLFLIKDFIQINRGKLYIISGNESYTLSFSSENFSRLQHSFPGTIVTLVFNLNDKTTYGLDSDDVEIQF